MRTVLFALPGNEHIARKIAVLGDMEVGELELRKFPDGESYVRVRTPVSGKKAVVVCALDRPDSKFLPTIFISAALRELGAAEIGLIAPYLCYMRQDTKFASGESVTSAHFSTALEKWFDWLVTIDPHLHRHKTMDELYSIPTKVLHAAPLLASWIKGNVSRPLLIGPDGESRQWVAEVARETGAPFIVLEKIRLGDREVDVSFPDTSQYDGHTPVLIDDIVSTGATMLKTLGQMPDIGPGPPVCLCVHGIFADEAYEALQQTGALVVSTNTIVHASNKIDVSKLLAIAFHPPKE
jgi:ribose-phosphate pyrophosphokinase